MHSYTYTLVFSRMCRPSKGSFPHPVNAHSLDKEVEAISIDGPEASRQEDFHSPAGAISYAEQPIPVGVLPGAWQQ